MATKAGASCREARMNCDLCKHKEINSANDLLCDGCAEMIQRLLTVQQRMESQQSSLATAVAA